MLDPRAHAVGAAMANHFDVAVVGGGLVGTSVAVAAARGGLSVALIEPSPPAAPSEEWDSRIYTFSPASRDFLSSLAVWQAVDSGRIQSVERMEVFGDQPGARLEFSAYQAGIATLADVAEASRVVRALWDTAVSLAQVEVFAPARCTALAVAERGAVLELAGGETLRASLVVGADGAHSWVRRMAGLTARVSSYAQLGVVANFATARPHDATAFQWFRADGVLAYLPLPGDRISMVWSTGEDHGRELLHDSAATLARKVADAGRMVLGELTLENSPQAFPLQRLTAERTVAPRVALVGDAAHVVHPLAGQGVNLGLGDARALADVLTNREPFRDCGDFALLRRYERSRAETILAMRAVTDGLATLFSLPGAAAAQIRNLGLNLTDRIAVLKNLLVRNAIG
jgi:2-octaprenylphenol hydroxylase